MNSSETWDDLGGWQKSNVVKYPLKKKAYDPMEIVRVRLYNGEHYKYRCSLEND